MKVERIQGTWTATGYGFRFESRTLEGLFRMVRRGLEQLEQLGKVEGDKR